MNLLFAGEMFWFFIVHELVPLENSHSVPCSVQILSVTMLVCSHDVFLS